MSGTHWEVEQKFRLVDKDATVARLDALGVRWSPAVQQSDHYFNHPARDFAQTDEAFRLRQVGNSNCLTYKGPKIDPSSKTRRELELALPPGNEVAAALAELLVALSFRSIHVVEKTRVTGAVRWEGFDVQVALDEVKNAGLYLELEIAATNETLGAARSAIQSLSSRLGELPVERRSYLEIILEKSA
jgi:adenylate cyclase class 2